MKKEFIGQRISTSGDFGFWDIAQVGGKGFSLSKLYEGGFNVPKSFCINTSVYQHYLNQDVTFTLLLNQFIANKLKQNELEEILKEKFLSIIFSVEFGDEILNEVSKLGDVNSDYFAVRSSATTEDLAEMSFAGQHDTFLNVQGIENIIQSIKKCWLSLWSSRAITYREQKKIKHSMAQMAVVIQRMIPAEKSGVTFSINPINGNTSQIVTNVVIGEGEKLVSGMETPCEYILSKSTHKILSSKIDNQQHTNLNSDELNLIVQTTKKIENYFGLPQDIEWSFAHSQLFILQSRPITTYPIVLDTERFTGNWTRIGFEDWLRKPMSPLFETLVIPILNNTADNFISDKINICRKTPTWTSIDGFFYTRISSKITFKTITVPYLFIKLVKNIYKEWNDDFVPQHETKIKELAQQDLKTATEIKAHLYKVIDANGLAWAYIILTGICAKLSEKVFSVLFNIFASSKYNLTYSNILSGYFNKSIEADEALWQLAIKVKKDKKLLDYILLGNNNLEKMSQLNQEWENNLKHWINIYGHRLFELDFVSPSIKDNPSIALNIIRTYLQNTTSNASPRHKYLDSLQKAESSRDLFFNKICKNAILGSLLLKSFKIAENYAKIRENRPFYLHLGWHLMRKDILMLAKIAKDNNHLNKIDDIFFISKSKLEEILNLIESGNKLTNNELLSTTEIINNNKAQYEKRKKINTLPNIVSSNGILNFVIKLFSSKKHKKGINTHYGHSGSTGIVRGKICKIEDYEDFHKFKENQILLAPYTTPAWTPLLAIAGGVITQHGGALSHAAIVAREYQIPAILGVDNIFQLLNDGDEVEINGGQGLLTIIKKNETYAR